MSRDSARYDTDLPRKNIASHYLQSTDVKPDSLSDDYTEYGVDGNIRPPYYVKTLYLSKNKRLSINDKFDKINMEIVDKIIYLNIDYWKGGLGHTILDNFGVIGVLGFLQIIKNSTQMIKNSTQISLTDELKRSMDELKGSGMYPKMLELLDNWTVNGKRLKFGRKTEGIINKIREYAKEEKGVLKTQRKARVYRAPGTQELQTALSPKTRVYRKPGTQELQESQTVRSREPKTQASRVVRTTRPPTWTDTRVSVQQSDESRPRIIGQTRDPKLRSVRSDTRSPKWKRVTTPTGKQSESSPRIIAQTRDNSSQTENYDTSEDLSYSDSTGGVRRSKSSEKIERIIEKYDKTTLSKKSQKNLNRQIENFFAILGPTVIVPWLNRYGSMFLVKFNGADSFEKITIVKLHNLSEHRNLKLSEELKENMFFVYGHQYSRNTDIEKLDKRTGIFVAIKDVMDKQYYEFALLNEHAIDEKQISLAARQFYADNRKISEKLSIIDRKFYEQSYKMSINKLNTHGFYILNTYPNLGILIILQALGRLIALHGKLSINSIFLRLNPKLMIKISEVLNKRSIKMKNSIESKYLGFLLNIMHTKAKDRLKQQQELKGAKTRRTSKTGSTKSPAKTSQKRKSTQLRTSVSSPKQQSSQRPISKRSKTPPKVLPKRSIKKYGTSLRADVEAPDPDVTSTNPDKNSDRATRIPAPAVSYTKYSTKR